MIRKYKNNRYAVKFLCMYLGKVRNLNIWIFRFNPERSEMFDTRKDAKKAIVEWIKQI